MGQGDIIQFLEREFRKDSTRTFTKKEIENGIEKTIREYSLRSLVNHGEIYREPEVTITSKGRHERYRYRYLPNGPFLITNF